MRDTRTAHPLTVCVIAGVLVSACTPVAPWQRGNLAQPHMALQPDPAAASIRQHIHASKEASAGGYGVGGGGCGCN